MPQWQSLLTPARVSAQLRVCVKCQYSRINASQPWFNLYIPHRVAIAESGSQFRNLTPLDVNNLCTEAGTKRRDEEVQRAQRPVSVIDVMRQLETKT